MVAGRAKRLADMPRRIVVTGEVARTIPNNVLDTPNNSAWYLE